MRGHTAAAPRQPLPRVVILGAGFAGRRAEAELLRSGRAEVTLIDAKPFLEFTPAVLRAVAQPSTAVDILVAHPRRVTVSRAAGVELLQREQGGKGGKRRPGPQAGGAVADETVAAVLLEDGRRVPSDYLIIACGASWALPTLAAAPGGVDARAAHFARAHATIAAAPSLLVVGGGEVGVELAAEVLCMPDPRPRVTLGH